MNETIGLRPSSEQACNHPRRWVVETKTKRVAKRPCRVCAEEVGGSSIERCEAV